jgi:hypothetical protein
MMAVHALVAYDDDGAPTAMFDLAAGRAAALFAVLAGVGVAFLTGRERVQPGAPLRSTGAALAARAAVIGGIGLVLGHLTDAEYAAVILPYYAVLFLLAIPLARLGTKALLATGAAIAVGVPVLSHLLRGLLPEPSGANLALADLVTRPFGLMSELLLTGEYPALSWAAYLCAGIAIGRMRLSTRWVAAGLLGAGTMLAAAASAVSDLLLGPDGGLAALRDAGTGMTGVSVRDILDFGADGVTPTTSWWWLAVTAPHSGTPLDLLHTTGTAVAMLGAALLLGHVSHVTAPAVRRAVDTVLNPVVAAGTMTLTLYTAHVLFLNSPLDVFDPVAGYLVQVAAALLFAVLWRRSVGRGPLERLAAGAARRARNSVAEAVPPALPPVRAPGE